MNTNEFNQYLTSNYGSHYTKEDALMALEVLKPYHLFDMVCEAGLSFMDDIREYVACWMMDLQKKESLQTDTQRDILPQDCLE